MHVLENPYLLINLFFAQIPAVAVFFGITHLVLRKITQIKIRLMVALAYLVAPMLILALSGWSIRAEKYSEGIKLLVPLILSALFCGGLYYQEWRRQRNKTTSFDSLNTSPQGASAQLHIETLASPPNSASVQREVSEPSSMEQRTQTAISPARLDVPELQDEKVDLQLPKNPSKTAINPHVVYWGVLGIVILSVALLAIFNGEPNYIAEDDGGYVYKETTEAAANKPLMLFRYAGIHNGKHQVYWSGKHGEIDFALECASPCKAIKKIYYINGYSILAGRTTQLRGRFDKKELLPADNDSVEARVMKDAINGRLKVHPLSAVTLQYNSVEIEPGMAGVPIRPVFSEDGISFEYLGPKPEAQATTPELKIAAAHPDWLTVLKTDQFKYWRDSVISDGKELMLSEDADYVIRRLTEFKEWRERQKQSDTRERLTTEELEYYSFARDLEKTHPDWREIMDSRDFHYWRDYVIFEGPSLKLSKDAKYISSRLTKFKEWREKQSK